MNDFGGRPVRPTGARSEGLGNSRAGVVPDKSLEHNDSTHKVEHMPHGRPGTLSRPVPAPRGGG